MSFSTRKCSVCRTEFNRNSRGRPRNYCSPACKQQAYRWRVLGRKSFEEAHRNNPDSPLHLGIVRTK